MSKNTLSAIGQANDRIAQRSQNTLRVGAAVKEGEHINIGLLIFEARLNAAYQLQQVGAYPIDLTGSSNAAAGTGVLTSDNTELTDGDTVTIGPVGHQVVYRFKDTPAQAYDVKRNGTTADTTLGNLRAAINASGTPGTEYFAGTLINPYVSAGAVTAHTITLTAKNKGTVFAATIATTEASSHLSFGAATLTGGTDASAAEFIAALPGGLAQGGSGLHGTALAAAVLIENLRDGAPLACTENLSGSGNQFDSATMYGGDSPEEIPAVRLTSRVPSAAEITAKRMDFLFKFAPKTAILVLRSSTGAAKAWDGLTTISGNHVTLTNPAGSTFFATNDVATVLASE